MREPLSDPIKKLALHYLKSETVLHMEASEEGLAVAYLLDGRTYYYRYDLEGNVTVRTWGRDNT